MIGFSHYLKHTQSIRCRALGRFRTYGNLDRPANLEGCGMERSFNGGM